MSHDTVTGSRSGGLVGELIDDMKQNNPPGSIDFGDIHGSSPQPLPSQGFGPMPGPGSGPNMGPGTGSGQTPMQITPQLQQLQQQFMNVIQQDPQLKQQFLDPQKFQSAMQDTNTMMNVIAYYQQQMASRPPPQSPPQSPPEDEESDDQSVDEEDKDHDGIHGGAQYKDQIDDLDPITEKSSWVDTIFRFVRGPIAITILFVILSLPIVRDPLIRWIPKLQDAPTLQLITFTLIFFIIIIISKLIAQYLM